MGRHSVPDPDEAHEADEPSSGAAPHTPDDRRSDANAEREQQPSKGLAGDAAGDAIDDGAPGLDDYGRFGAGFDAGSGAGATTAHYDDRSTPAFAGDDLDAPTRSFDATPPLTTTSLTAPPSTASSGPQHGGNWEGGEWTGSHRAITDKRRGVSTSVIVALVAVVVVVGAVILWRFFGGVLSNRSHAAAVRCVSGNVDVAVVADPTIAGEIKGLAEDYERTAAHVGDRCVKVDVRSADSSQVVGGFVGPWPAELGARPAMWIPGSSISSARLRAAAGKETVTAIRSLVTSPVMLAVRPELKNALAQRDWRALPSLQTNPTSLNELNLAGWGSLRAAFPLDGNGDASYAAAEAVAAAAAPAGGAASAGAGAVTTVLAAQPRLADGGLTTALDVLLQAGPPAADSVHAVVTTEQQIHQRSSGLASARDQLAAWQPAGPTAQADYPSVLLAGDWLDREKVTAASDFDKYMRKPEALSKLVAAGFRAAGTDAALPKDDVVTFGDVAAPLAVGDDEARAAIANAVGAPARSPAVTILLDQSMNTTEGGRSRVANVTAALNARLQTLPPTAAVGLWTFDGVSGRSEVPLEPLGDSSNGESRGAALRAALDRQTASNGGAVSFTTLRLLYPEAQSNFREGQRNSVLVITAGPHTDQSLDGAGLQSFVKSAFVAARPVAIDVIDFGTDPDRSAWEAVAQATGGNYQNLTTSGGPELGAAIAAATG